MTVILEYPIVTPCLSYQYRTKNDETRNGDEHYTSYTYTLLQTSKGTVHGQVRDCTSASPICRLLWHSSSSLTPSFPFFFLHQNPLPPPSPLQPLPHLQLRFCSSLFFAAPTSSSFTPSSPPLSPLLRQHERSLHTGPPFPRADGLCPLFSTSGRLDAKIIYVFLSSFPSNPHSPVSFSSFSLPPPSFFFPLSWVRTSNVVYGNNRQGFSRLDFRGTMEGWIRVSGFGEVELFCRAAVCRFCKRGRTWFEVWFRNGGNRVNAMRCGKWRKLEGGFWVNYRVET